MLPSDDRVFVYLVVFAVSEAGRRLPEATASDHRAGLMKPYNLREGENIYITQYSLIA